MGRSRRWAIRVAGDLRRARLWRHDPVRSISAAGPARCQNVTLELPPSRAAAVWRSLASRTWRCKCTPGEPLPAAGETPYDFQIPLLSLPRVFGTTLDTIPGGVPYLQVNDQRAGAVAGSGWQQYRGLKVGIAWQGRPTHRDDRYRSIPLGAVCRVGRLHGVRLVEPAEGSRQRATWVLANSVPGSRLAADYRPSGRCAGGSGRHHQNLDLLITCDTSLGHLAGALGVPVWVALPAYTDWRWFATATTRPGIRRCGYFANKSKGAGNPFLPTWQSNSAALQRGTAIQAVQ